MEPYFPSGASCLVPAIQLDGPDRAPRFEYREFFRVDIEFLDEIGLEGWRVISAVYEPYIPRGAEYPYEPIDGGWTGLAIYDLP